MIVKDEAHVIERCLLTARDWVDYWVIVDTGSSDDTKAIIERVMDGAPGQLIDSPWINFEVNRQEVLDWAKTTSECDYAVWIDADEVFTGPPTSRGDFDLTLDGYFLDVDYDGLTYKRLAVTNLDRNWRWVGPVHEYLECVGGGPLGNLDRPRVKVRHDGARSHDPETYVKDATLLASALMEDPDNARLRFYYAQSLKDAGKLSAAKEEYRERIALGGWKQEVYISHMQMGRLSERLGDDDAVDCYLRAYETCPDRAEALVELARIFRTRHQFHVAYLFAEPAVLRQPPENALFIDTACYTWRAWDELALAAWYTGNKTVALDAALQAVLHNPADERLRQNVALMG
jgi:tetratricopeptide (TPR) repeat protein